MPSIHFFKEDIAFKLKRKKEIKLWLKETIAAEGYKLNELNYIFCSDNYLHQLNLQYLDHDTLTDIITFDNAEKKQVVTGDVFISVERVLENSKLFHTEMSGELHRVMVHGVLHLLGYKDKTKADKDLMTAKENEYLSKRNFT